MTTLARIAAALLPFSFAPVVAAEATTCSEPRGLWEVVRDDDPEEASVVNREAGKLGAPVFAVGAAFRMRRPLGDVPSDKEKKYTLDEWNYQLAVIFDKHGFYEAVGTDRFKAKMQEVLAKMPYNQRQLLHRTQGPVQFVVNDIDPQCLGDDEDGLIGAFSLMSYPKPEAGSDWGAVTVVVMGLGQCGPESAEGRALAAKVMRDVTHYLCRDLKELPQ